MNAIVEDLINEMMALPKDKDSYGLIHNDMHQWNFLLDGDKINVFDFDDSLHGWFALDIGIALYHALWWGRKDDAGNDFTDSIILNGQSKKRKVSIAINSSQCLMVNVCVDYIRCHTIRKAI